MRHPLREAQRLGLDLDRHIVMDAGAGTGKTTVMVERYVQHLLSPHQRAVLVTPRGIRPPSLGAGASLAAPRDRITAEDWPGLLPGETVAITFTRKAAGALRAGIKHRIGAIRGAPIEGDDDGVVDVRWRGVDTAVVDLLTSLLDDAPISTIDSFLQRLVSPYIDELMPRRIDGVVPEEQVEALHNLTLASVWRLRGAHDAPRLGITDGRAVIEARDRLSVALGGQAAAHRVLSKMLRNAAFVDEARTSLMRMGEGSIDAGTLRRLVEQAAVSGTPEGTESLFSFVEELRSALRAWHDHLLTREKEYVLSKEKTDGTQTRFRQLRRWCDHAPPTDVWEALRWVFGAVRLVVSEAALGKLAYSSAFPRMGLPSDLGWPSGCKGAARGKDPDTAKAAFIDGYEDTIQAVRELLEVHQHHWWVLLGACALDLEPGLEYEFLPANVDLWPVPLAHPLPVQPVEGHLSTGSAFSAQVMADLFTLHAANRQASDLIKAEQGLIDFEDVQRMAADLLLAHCPESVRPEWSVRAPNVVAALDDLPAAREGAEQGPWSDEHIERALGFASEHEDIARDLQRRWDRLRRLRREFRAFIIDEFQDTNPAHYRLLARLWGPRERRQSEPAPTNGAWDPTVCVVGDMKQSIYRFRQADVRVMRNATSSICFMNALEADEPRLLPYRESDAGRDPRPVGDGGTAGGVHSALDHVAGQKGAPWSHVPFGSDPRTLELRRLGHIELDENWRTSAPLMHTLNGLFETILGEGSRTMNGDWYANPQRLQPMRTTEAPARLEWLMPVRIEEAADVEDLRAPLDPFRDPRSSQAALEDELIAARIAALVSGAPVHLTPTLDLQGDEPVAPGDVLVLVHSRGRAAGIVEQLRERNVPVMVDRQGDLLNQPVVLPLLAALNAVAHPTNRHAMAVLGRTAAFALNDRDLDAALTTLRESNDVWSALATVLDERRSHLALRCAELAHQGAIHDVLDVILDESDLLVAWPSDADRQHAERFCLLVRDLAGRHGEDPVVLSEHLAGLQRLERDGPSAVVEPSGGAVEVMTIHNAKGLERDVVVVAGLFTAGGHDASFAARDNVRVLPDLVVARTKPWPTKDFPDDAMWRMAKALDDAQAKAERARQLYVAMTRVGRHLILAGAREGTTLDADGRLHLPLSSSSTMTFGDHLLSAFPRLAGSHNDEHPFLVQGPVDDAELVLDPELLATDAGLGPEAVPSMLVLHHPSQLPLHERSTPLNRLVSLTEAPERLEGIVAAPVQPLPVQHRLRVTPHGLDTARACRRRHWLGSVRGWVPEPFGMPTYDEDAKPRSRDDGAPASGPWPAPTLFGTIVHRAVELGLANPASDSVVVPALPSSWTGRHASQLRSSDLIDRVLAEHGGQAILSTEARQRVLEVLALIEEGPLGRLADGQAVAGRSVHGLRTEHPFLVSLPMGGPLPRTAWRAGTRVEVARVEQPMVEVDGRIDLVVALEDEHLGPCLQVVDLKTSGCMEGWHEHPLRHGLPTDDRAERTAAEVEELERYALQLTLYTMALEVQEAAKPEGQRRTVLPPALLLAASGRLVEMTRTELDVAMSDASSLMRWMVHLSLDAEALEEPAHLPAEAASTCAGCPYYRGTVRLCGPEGEALGYGARHVEGA
jgi:superfamily I DNA/RNA helicase